MRPATLAGCGAIALWAFLAVLAKAAGDVPPLQLTAMAFAVSGLLGLGVVAARGRLRDLRQPGRAWAPGVGGLFGYHAMYFAALGLAPAAPANLLNYLWPLLIVLFSAPLLGLRPRPAHLAGAALGFAGCLALVGQGAAWDGEADAVAGYALALGAAGTWALYSVLARRLAHVPTEAVAGFCATTAVLAGAAHLLFEPNVWPGAKGFAAAATLGAGPTGAAFFLWDFGMKRGDPRLLGTLAYAAPVGSTLLLCAAGYAPLTASTLVAAALVAAGGLLAARASAGPTAPSPAPALRSPGR